jgi:hypothetical protein
MKRVVLVVMLFLVILAVAGCGDGGESRHLLAREILSDETVDADIAKDPATGSLTLTQVARDQVPSVFAGIDPTTLQEFRAFLHFPLASIPFNGIIQSATLDLFIETGSDLPPTGSIPIRLELVSFPPPVLVTDYDEGALPILAVRTFPISAADIGHHVVVDVTSLMVTAQANRLQNFQIRILEDFGPVTPGIIEIDDTTSATAPLLKVFFFQ